MADDIYLDRYILQNVFQYLEVEHPTVRTVCRYWHDIIMDMSRAYISNNTFLKLLLRKKYISALMLLKRDPQSMIVDVLERGHFGMARYISQHVTNRFVLLGLYTSGVVNLDIYLPFIERGFRRTTDLTLTRAIITQSHRLMNAILDDLSLRNGHLSANFALSCILLAHDVNNHCAIIALLGVKWNSENIRYDILKKIAQLRQYLLCIIEKLDYHARVMIYYYVKNDGASTDQLLADIYKYI